jgi:hypothetical protein
VGSESSPLSCGVFLPPLLLQAFPLLVFGHVLQPLPSPAGLFIYSSHGKWGFPPLLWSFPPTATFISFPAPGCWVCAASPAFSSWLVRDFPSPPSVLRVLCPPSMCLFCCYCLLFSFFSLGWGSVCPGGYADLAQGCLWEYRVLLSSPCGLCLPKSSGCCRLVVAQEPSWFLHLTWSGDDMLRLEVWRSQRFASWWFFLPGVSPASLQDFTLGGTPSASSL